MTNKVLTGAQAVGLIESGSTVALEGFVGALVPEYLAMELEKRFLSTQTPTDLTIVFASGLGDGKEKGLNHLAHTPLIKRAIGGYWNLSPKLCKLATENKIEAYNFSIGVIAQLYRYIAAKKVGNITKIGLDTFIDPRISGGKLNEKTKEDMVELINIHGEEYLLYKAFPIDYALLRGTYADSNGNISFEEEGVCLDALSIAQAVKNNGGKVIVQVKEVVDKYLDPWKVKIPGIYVDHVVVAEPEYHMQTFGTDFNKSICGLEFEDVKEKTEDIERIREIICRRAAMELRGGGEIVNLGIGMPEGVSIVCVKNGTADKLNLTVESGPIGGVPLSQMNFGCSKNPSAIIPQSNQFDFYQGGGIDIAILGLAQADKLGNVNVSKFGTRLSGCGGFVDITQSAKRIVFCGTFNASGLKVDIKSGNIHILNEGAQKKFVSSVEQITFSAKNAVKNGIEVKYITERAVFELSKDGLILTEIAPGIDLNRDILDQMEFKPLVPPDLKLMDKTIFDYDA